MDAAADLSIEVSLMESLQKTIDWTSANNIVNELQRLWDPDYKPIAHEDLFYPEFLPRGVCGSAPEPRREVPPEPEWLIGMTPEFKRSIKGVDKTLQGRLLEAIAKLSEEPLRVVGDTIKPLDGDLRGLWRYRIGDYRLVYRPDSRTYRIVLLCFSARGGAYAYA
jgi:addiction module RelE/StbE family toxin